jgi:putative endonuclease
MRTAFVYILASRSRVLYIGVTTDLERRLQEHKLKLTEGFTKKYSVDRLVHLETFADIRDAIARERQIKGWRRAKKVALIEAANPKWLDLSEKVEYSPPAPPPSSGEDPAE